MGREFLVADIHVSPDGFAVWPQSYSTEILAEVIAAEARYAYRVFLNTCNPFDNRIARKVFHPLAQALADALQRRLEVSAQQDPALRGKRVLVIAGSALGTRMRAVNT